MTYTRNTQAKYASRSFICIICGRLSIGKLWCMVVLGGLSKLIMRVEYACIRTGV